MKTTTVYVLGSNSEGFDFFETTVSVSKEDYDNGKHYDLAKEAAGDAGFEEPMIAFDEFDAAARRLIR